MRMIYSMSVIVPTTNVLVLQCVRTKFLTMNVFAQPLEDTKDSSKSFLYACLKNSIVMIYPWGPSVRQPANFFVSG